MQLSGGAACCKSPSDCTILANKEALAQDVLQLALLYNLSGYTQCATRCFNSSALSLCWSATSNAVGAGTGSSARRSIGR
eukprot:COSAG04_NODE_3595_length_2681_cov_1.787761_3_plen_80_part_00